MIEDLHKEEYRWYYRNSEKASILYVGKRQQEQIEQCWNEVVKFYNPINSVPSGGFKRYYGYRLIYVDEEDYIRLGD